MRSSITLGKQHRPRAGGYHVKTGCTTCRVRHVKCDEDKPACLKCRSTGRVCDGYPTTHKYRTSPAVLQNQSHMSTTGVVAIPPVFNREFVGTDKERRGFEYFRWETEQDVGSALNLDLAHRLILQMSHSNAAVRSAVVALGSIAEHAQINDVLIYSEEQAISCHDFAQAQYHQALMQLREQIANDPDSSENPAIVSCFLFTLFDFLQGNDTASMVHLRSGLNMLRQQGGPPDHLRQELLHIFSTMDMQATLWMGFKSLQSSMRDPLILALPVMGIDCHSDIEEAATSLTFLVSRVYQYRRLVTNEVAEQVSPSLIARKQDLGMQLEWWPLALEKLLIDIGIGLSLEMLHRILVMRMNHIITRIAFGACLHENEAQVFRAHLPDFRTIVALAKNVLRPMDSLAMARIQRIVAANNASVNPGAILSFYAGLIQPLYMTAIQCTDTKLCREAIDLLSTTPWREGAWDSVKMARMAKRKVRQLEKRAILAMALI